MRIVLTNDDGVEAPGLAALAGAAAALGEAVIVAPAAAESGVGHMLTTHVPIRVDELAARRFRVDGRPADCARIALTHLAPDADWVLSGVNHGANLGVDVYTSGTVAAAREAALLGRRALAISQYIGPGGEADWELTAARAAAVLPVVLARELEPGHFWNINLPLPSTSEIALPIVFCGIDTGAHAVRYRRSGSLFVYEGNYHARPRQPGRDVDVCMSGRVAVTKVTLEIAADA
jgi:5'-nucleotidase